MTSAISSQNKDYTLPSVAFFFTLTGLAIRLAPALQTQFPLNDGGLFYSMIVDLQEEHYTLPLFTTYNHAEIPFAYPPLAFYLSGLLADLFRISPLDLIRFVPALVSTLTIPAFYLLAKEITDSKLQVGFGVFAFSLVPRDFVWLIMGGGITRSFGLLFALLTMVFAYRFYNEHQTRHLLGCILLGTLTVTTHPEATVHTAITALIFYLWKDRSIKGLLISLGIAAGILVLTAPWWGLVISRHSASPFFAAMTASRQDSINPLVSPFIFFRFLFTDEAFLPILSMLGLIGLFASLARKQTFLPAWLFILHTIEPRGGTLYMMIPLALLIGHALENVILPALQPKDDRTKLTVNIRQALENILHRKTPRYFLIFLFAYSLMSAYVTGQKVKNDLSLQRTDMETFSWIKENTSKESDFLLVTGQLPLRDAWSEWFPVLTDRHSQATVFGYEWVPDGRFRQRIEEYKSLQACLYKNVTCLNNWSEQVGANFSYVYLWNRFNPERFPLSLYLRENPEYELVFQNEKTLIFQNLR